MRLIDADALKQLTTKRNHIWDIVTDSCGRGLTEIIDSLPTIDAVKVVRCNQCKHYEGVHGVQGNAPCAFWGIGGVMWDDFCKRGERWDG